MILEPPSSVRAACHLPSSPPRCTPSASTCIGQLCIIVDNEQSSRIHMSSSRKAFAACCRRKAGSCRSCCGIAIRVRRHLQSVNAYTGATNLMLYRCNVRRDCIQTAINGRSFDFHLLCSSSSSRAQNKRSGMCCPMPGRKPYFSASPGVFLRFIHGFFHRQAICQQRGDRCSQSAAGSVINSWQSRPAVAAHQAAFAIQGVDHFGGVLMRAGDQHILASQLQYALGALRQYPDCPRRCLRPLSGVEPPYCLALI